MKRIFRKNQVIITVLAVMIAVAGYLNYSGRLLEKEAGQLAASDQTVLLTAEEETADAAQTGTYVDIISMDGDGEAVSSDGAAGEETGNDAAPGAAVLASASAGDALMAQAKLNREQIRAKNKETLLEVINNENVDQQQRQEAAASMTSMTKQAEMEAAAELLLEAKGYKDAVVSITDGTADVVINMEELDSAQLAQIEDIVKRKTEVTGEHIIITPRASQETEEK